MKLSRYSSLPLILSIPIAWLAVLFTGIYVLYALLPGDFDPDMKKLGMLFYAFILPYLLLAVPLMSYFIRKSKRNSVIFQPDRVSWMNVEYLLAQYELYYYPITWRNYHRYRPGLLVLRQKQNGFLSAEESLKEIEIGMFTRKEIRKLEKIGLSIGIN